MKLRIRGNSLRIRVSQKELAQISSEGIASDAVRFTPTRQLRYVVRVGLEGPLAAEFSDSEIRVTVPESAVSRWLQPEEVAIIGEQALDRGDVLKILLEKDFTCLAPREGEDDSDSFPNPAAATP